MSRADRSLRLLSLVSGLYDLVVGALMLFALGQVVELFQIPPPNYPINGNLNGVFLIAVAIGYAWPARDPQRYRFYLWIMGVFLKGAGAVLFIFDVFWRGSPGSFLLFALSDGTLATITLVLLRAHRAAAAAESPRPGSP